MNVDFDNKYARAVHDLLWAIGFSPDRVRAVNITEGVVEVLLNELPHADPALITKSTITIHYSKERP